MTFVLLVIACIYVFFKLDELLMRVDGLRRRVAALEEKAKKP